MFTKESPEAEVARYTPKFQGEFSVTVKDTWEEYVTKMGSDCGRCGETCTTSGSGPNETRSCSCNFCTWQELETFYAPWSTQKVKWYAEYHQDQNYRKRRQEWQGNWIANGKRDEPGKNLQELFTFDPDRPLEYYLFPGEVEHIVAQSFYGSSLTPKIEIKKARHEYKIVQRNSEGRPHFECDDRDFSMRADIYTGKRLVTKTPNAIEFRPGWIVGARNRDGTMRAEPNGFQITDSSARRYTQQERQDQYKDTDVQIWLEQLDRFWWFDARISKKTALSPERSNLVSAPLGSSTNPAVGVYDLKAAEIFRNPYWGTQFHLAASKKYMVCSRMLQQNNVYYKTKKMFFLDNWSEENCAAFTYAPPKGGDERGFLRKSRDVLSRIAGFGLF